METNSNSAYSATSLYLRLLPDPVIDFEDYRDRKRLEREDRLDRFEQDSDPRYA